MLIKGITVTLYEKTITGKNEFNKPIYEETPVDVNDVLIEPISAEEVVSAESLYGKKAVCRLCLPKGDDHKWNNSRIVFWGKEFVSFGPEIEYIEDNVPLRWNKKIMVERYG